MVFLRKIRNYIKNRKNKEFRDAVAKEKNQKYLFRDENPIIKKKGVYFFRKNGERTSPFVRYIKDKIDISPRFSTTQETYMKYIGIFLIVSCVYILLYSPYFLMSPSKVLIEGVDDGIDISIAYRSIEHLYGKNIFLIDEKELATSIKKYQKNISLIRIDRLYPNNIKILISSYPLIFDTMIPSVRGKAWYMTDNGVLIPKDRIELTLKYKLIYIDPSLSNDLLYDYRELLSESTTQVIKKTIELFEESWPNLGIEKILYLKNEDELHFILKSKMEIFFTMQDFTQKIGETKNYNHLRSQLQGLKVFIDNHMSDMEKGLYTYIDARIPGKIFSCREREVCMRNLGIIYPDIFLKNE